jgi:hypothetical protein
VPKCNLAVSVFDNVEDPNEKAQNEKAHGTKVHIKLSFNYSKGGEELKADLAEIEHDQMAKAPVRRHGTSVGGFRETKKGDPSATYFAQRKDRNGMARAGSEMTYRPYSAKTDFNGSYSRNPNKRNQANKMMTSQHFMNNTPSMKTLNQRRPQTAASHAMMKSSASIGRFNTMETKMGMQSSISYSHKGGHSRMKLKTKVKDLEFHGEVNQDGEAIFSNIPKSVYTIVADQSDFFKSSEKEVSLPIESETYGRIEVFVPLEKQHAYSTTIYMTRSPGVKDHEHEVVEPTESQDPEESKDFEETNANYHTDLELRAIILDLYEKKKKSMEDDIIDIDSEDEEIDYEEDFETYEDKKGISCYKCRLMPGKYMVVAKGRSIKEFSQIISIEDQITILAFTPDAPMKKLISCYAYDAKTGETLNNVLVKVRKTHSKITTQGLTRDGSCVFTITQNCAHTVEVFRKGYISYTTQMNQTKGSEDMNIMNLPLLPIESVRTIKIPNPENADHEMEILPGYLRIVLMTDSNFPQMNLQLHACTVDAESGYDEEVTIDGNSKKFKHDHLKATYKPVGESGACISVSSHMENRWFRLCASFVSAESSDPSTFNYDQSFKNPLEDVNARVHIFNENKLLNTVIIPSYIDHMTNWDIGILNMGKHKFIKINS